MGEGRFYIETYGCQMNEHDSERMASILAGEGYVRTDDPREANLILVNTCSVRGKPEHKAYSAIGRFTQLKLRRKGLVVGMAGCVAQQEGEELLRRFPLLDLVMGTHQIPRLAEFVKRIREEGVRIAETTFQPERQFDRVSTPPALLNGRRWAYVTIMQGCDNFCSFCIVPYVRGREKSRPSREILDEIRRLADAGVVEVYLLGQNVNSYGLKEKGEISFVELLERINEIPGIRRIRFTTSHPKDLSQELIRAFGRLEKLCEHIHLPVQSGSDSVLARMNRKYTVSEYLDKVEALRRIKSDIAITTDIIVGFPGETEEDFEKTLKLVRLVRYDSIYSFKYSPRPGTAAAAMEDRVGEEEASRRLRELQKLQDEITLQKNVDLVGKTLEVLIEGPAPRSPGLLTGRSRCNRVVNFELDGVRPDRGIVSVKVKEACKHSLRGEAVSS